jgi:hypothetical protein
MTATGQSNTILTTMIKQQQQPFLSMEVEWTRNSDSNGNLHANWPTLHTEVAE